MHNTRKLIVCAVSVFLVVLTVAATAFAAGGSWRMAGNDLANTRYAPDESTIGPGNVSNLAVRWVVNTGGEVSATPAVDGASVYFPDAAGNLYKLNRDTGQVLWSRSISDYTGITGDFSRTTPALVGNKLILGNQGGAALQGATLLAVNKVTGNLQWATVVDAHPAAVISQSPVVVGKHVFVGIASREEALAALSGYPCCSFRGSVVSLDVKTGQIVWRTYTAPGLPGYSGNAVWGGMPAVDRASGTLYVTTGNNYSLPQTVLNCVAANAGDPSAIAACSAADNFFDSILALDLGSGAIKWALKTEPFDAWNEACLPPATANCPSPTGPDYDFGEGPALFKAQFGGGKPYNLVGAGAQSGQYWTLNADTGSVVWTTITGPGSWQGGLTGGSAVDGQRIYAGNANGDRVPSILLGGQTVDYGFWNALDATTGEILWQTADPVAGSLNQGAVTAANGVAYACSLDASGHMYAFDAATGTVLWSFASGAPCRSGPAVVDGRVYWGAGSNKMYAFQLP